MERKKWWWKYDETEFNDDIKSNNFFFTYRNWLSAFTVWKYSGGNRKGGKWDECILGAKQYLFYETVTQKNWLVN